MGENLTNKKIGAIIQARMGSTRLPGKVLKKIGEKSILEIVINRIKKSEFLDEIIVATTKKKQDDQIIELCKKLNVKFFRGDENNVLNRYILAADQYKIDIIVRVTSDNPLTSPFIIDELLKKHLQKNFDYTYSTKIPPGIGVEIVNLEILKKVAEIAKDKNSKEHVTIYIKNHPEYFKINYMDFKLKDYGQVNLTVDTKEDFELMLQIYEEMGDFKKLKIEDVIEFLSNKHEITIIIRTYNSEKYIEEAINSALKQTIKNNLFKILIVDDGSTDKTRQILKKYKNEIELIELSKIGNIKVLNYAIKKAKGRYIILLDSDDYFEPNILDELYNKINTSSENTGFIYCDYFEYHEETNVKKIISLKDNIFNSLAAGIMFKKEIIKEFGYYDEKMIFPEYDLLIKIMSKYKGIYIPKPLYTYRRHKGNLTANNKYVKNGKKQLYDKYGEKIPIRNY